MSEPGERAAAETRHYVCTHEEALRLIGERTRFWVQNCGCREGRSAGCSRSRPDVCVTFLEESHGSGGSLRHEITRSEVEALVAEAGRAPLVARPFRRVDDPSVTEGICFCCDDCCAYFLDPSEPCDPASWVETTDAGRCDDCGACVPVCFFGARSSGAEGGIAVDRSRCYGCGLCVDSCPQGCITLVARP